MKLGTARVETFSDSVMAIIITIMAFSFKLPEMGKEGTHWSVRHHLYTILPSIVTYSFSFLMI
ncbi:MAG TPA: TMEM175 family protein, partial [Flavisolibacter sp.]|nr:TMEM175 family protein [Flavisolibacter sp.]